MLCILPQNAFSQDHPQAAPQKELSSCIKLTDIEFDGLKRTKKDYIMHELAHHLGECIHDVDLGEVETELQALGLFDEIDVKMRQTGAKRAVLDISFKEKWYYLPIPMFSYVDEFMGGLIFMDMNAFGENNKFIIGGFGSKSRIRGMASFSTPSLVGRPGLSFFGSAASDEVTVRDINKHIVLKYRSINYMLGAKLNYKFTLHSTATFGVGYQYGNNTAKKKYEDSIGSGRKLSVSVLSLNAGYQFEKLDWNGWFMSGIRITANGELGLVDSDELSPSITAGISYQRPIFTERLRFLAHAGLYYAYQSRIPMYQKARTVGADILPNKFISPAMMAAGTGLEVGIYRFKWASFSIGAQYQIAYAQDWDESMDFHHGWSSGVNVNLSKIAFPAFSLGAAHDVTSGEFKFALGMGMSI
ncbi:MAG: hypothetical protein J6A01_01300 [Proteobacteria bacterium]|nr:hypothetical protein [Pseudomonadota bacterium]